MNIELFILALVVIGILAWTIYLYYKLAVYKIQKKQYTREYFAVLGINALVTVGSLVLSYIFASQLWVELINLLVKVVCHKFVLETSAYLINVPQPSKSDSIVAILFLLITYYFTITMFRSWKGDISQRQAEEDIKREVPNIFSDFLAYVKQDPKLNIHVPKKDIIDFALIQTEEDRLPWHIQLAELLIIKSNQYKIDVETDWYGEHSTLISKYGKNNDVIAIFCCISEPCINEQNAFLSFVKKSKFNPTQCIIAIENPHKISSTFIVNDIFTEIMYKHEILDLLIDFSSYNNYIKKRFEKDEIIQGYPITLNQTYTTPSGKIKLRTFVEDEDDNQEQFSDTIESIENYVIDWLNNNADLKQLAILGEYGQGKSVLAQQICYLINEGKVQSSRIPILIELRGKFPKQFSETISLFSDWATSFGIDPRGLMKLHLAGKLLIIFEGFDEMELVGDYNIRLDHFRKLWEFATPNAKFIITGRPNFFLNDNELKTLLRTSDEFSSSNHYCEEIHINPFNKEQINQALRFTDDDIRRDILQTIENQGEASSFFDLISRPTHLFMASLVWKERLSQYKSNINSALVYKEFLDHSYSRQDRRGMKTPLSTFERAYFMQGIAVNTASRSIFTNQIGQKKLKEVILKLYNAFPNEITKRQAVLMTNAIPLIDRFDKIYDKETVFLDIRSCGVLVRDLSTFDTFKFAHKSFMEYLVSDYYLIHILKDNMKFKDADEKVNLEIVSKNSIKLALNIDYTEIHKSPEIFNFIVQLLCNKVNIDKKLSDEAKAKKVYSLVYKYKKIPLKWALYLRPFLSLNYREKLSVITMCLTLVALIMTIFQSITTIFQGNYSKLILVFISIVSGLTTFIFIQTFSNKTKFSIPFEVIIFNIERVRLINVLNEVNDEDNLLLWFSACKELGVSDDSLKDLMTENSFNKFNEELSQMSERRQFLSRMNIDL